MIFWIESQSSILITVAVFAFCYVLAALIYAGTRLAARRAGGLHLTTPSMLSALGVVTGLVIAFVASHVWTNLTEAEEAVAREASAIRNAMLLSEALPPDLGAAVLDGVRAYHAFIEDEDWPAMAEGRANLHQTPPGLPAAMKTVLGPDLAGSGQATAQQRTVVAIEDALDARRHRILLSEAAIDPTQWGAILTLTVLMLLAIGLVHVDRVAAAANLFIFSSAVAACLVILLVSDRPFSPGGTQIRPTAVHDVAPE
jgi:hypothetical protein